MRLVTRGVRSALVTALAGASAVVAWQWLIVQGNYSGNWTGLFCTGERWKLPEELRARTVVFPEASGYDGQFYRLIAYDPLFQKGYAALVDSPRLRYWRILVPASAHVLALGNAGWIDAAYIAVVALSILTGIYWTSRLVLRYGRNPWWGLLFLLLPATLASMDRMVLDATLAALFAGFLYYSGEGHARRFYAVCALAALAKETGLILPAAAAAAAWMGGNRRRAAAIASAALPAIAWYVFASWHTSNAPLPDIIEWPGWGIVRRAFTFYSYDRNPSLTPLLNLFDLAAILGLALSLVLALRWVWKRPPGAEEISVLLFAVLALVLGSRDHMRDAFGYARPPSPLLLALMARGVITGRRWTLVPPLMVTAGVALVLVRPTMNALAWLVRFYT